MSDYTIAVNWAGKDALTDTDPGKIISGTDFNREFVAVRDAINSKADLNGSPSENFACNLITADDASINGQAVILLDTPQTFTKAHNTLAEEISMTSNQTANLLNTDVFEVSVTTTGKTLSVSNLSAGAQVTFLIKNQGEYTLTLDSVFRLPGGTAYEATSGANKVDKITCVSDGISLFCTLDSDL